jgi:Gelsolin repeat
MCVQGKRTVRVRAVAVSTDSLNTGDVFILDLGLTIYIYNGPLANKYEKVKGLEVKPVATSSRTCASHHLTRSLLLFPGGK